MAEQATCGLCGEPMPPGEEMFQYHGYSGPCPKPAAAREATPPAPEWQPIATAPTDGRSVVATGDGLRFASFDARFNRWIDDDDGCATNPTGWIPLPSDESAVPAPPAGETARGSGSPNWKVALRALQEAVQYEAEFQRVVEQRNKLLKERHNAALRRSREGE